MAVAPEHVPAQLANARVLHLGSSTLAKQPSRAATLRAVELATAAGCAISIDPNLRPHLWDDVTEARALLQPTLSRAAVVKVSDDELELVLGERFSVEDGAATLRKMGAGVVLVTSGADGAYYDAPAGTGRVATPLARAFRLPATVFCLHFRRFRRALRAQFHASKRVSHPLKITPTI